MDDEEELDEFREDEEMEAEALTRQLQGATPKAEAKPKLIGRPWLRMWLELWRLAIGVTQLSSEPHLVSNQQSVECHIESYGYTLMISAPLVRKADLSKLAEKTEQLGNASRGQATSYLLIFFTNVHLGKKPGSKRIERAKPRKMEQWPPILTISRRAWFDQSDGNASRGGKVLPTSNRST